MKHSLYPLKFQPILKEKIWGGEKLKTFLKKPLNHDNIGESWELSSVDGAISIVSNGYYKGTSLNKLLKDYGKELLGNKNHQLFGNKFPLLIKFIDAKKDLSVQLHPDDKLAKKRHDSLGKTEMWYVIQADEGARLMVGFNQKMDSKTYLKHLNEKTLPAILNVDEVDHGDTYFIEAGRIHAIGGGVLLAEIQQTSDVTYRVYDWDRKDANGNERELHNDIAIDAFNFEMDDDFRISYKKAENNSNSMVICPYFTTNFIPVKGIIQKKNDKDSFIIYICVDGEAEIITYDHKEVLKTGETVLLPARLSTYSINSKSAKLLEVYID